MSLNNKSQFRPSVGVAINAYGDPILLESILELLVSSPIVDKILVLDGPYLFCLEVFKQFGFYTDESDSPIKKICDVFESKVYYSFGVFVDEADKRISLYSSLDTDIIILLDTDELPLAIHSSDLLSFWESSAEVATLQMYNIFNEKTMIGDAPRKKAVFKRDLISASDHLDYTWLIGVSQKPTTLENVSTLAIADISHFTMLRTSIALQQKFIFYTTLWHKTHRQAIFNDAGSYLTELGFSSSAISLCERETLLNTIIRTDPAYAGFPSSQPAFPLPPSIQDVAKTFIDKFGLINTFSSSIVLRNDNKPVYLTIEDNNYDRTAPLSLLISNASSLDLSSLSISCAEELDGSIAEFKSTISIAGNGPVSDTLLLSAILPPASNEDKSLPIRLSIRYNGRNESCAVARILPLSAL